MIGTKTEQREAKGKALALGLVVAAVMAACLLLVAKPAHAATPSPSTPRRMITTWTSLAARLTARLTAFSEIVGQGYRPLPEFRIGSNCNLNNEAGRDIVLLSLPRERRRVR